MSGFEVAGIVLAVLPLAIDALRRFQAGKSKVHVLLKYRGHFDRLIERLGDQAIEFRFHIMILLREAGALTGDDIVDVSIEECVELLQDPRLGEDMKQYLGHLYDPFLERLARYENCLREIVGSLGHITRLPNTAKDDLFSIVQAHNSKTLGIAGRISFSMKQPKLEALLEDLGVDRVSLKSIIEGIKTQREYAVRDPSNEARRLAAVFNKIRLNAASLFNAICRSCTCKCRDTHKVMMRLDSRLPAKSQKRVVYVQKKEAVIFGLFLEIEHNRFQEALVECVSSESRADIGNTRSSIPPKRAVRFNVPTITVLEAVSPNAQSLAPGGGASIDSDHAYIIDICQRAKEAQLLKQILALELAADILALQNQAKETQRICTVSVTLADVLDSATEEREKMTPKQKTLLALSLAASVLQLRETYWCDSPWSSKAIKFITQPSGGLSTHDPLVEQTIRPSIAAQPAPATSGPKPILLELAIMLLEIYEQKSLETWTTQQSLAIDDVDQRNVAARKWLEDRTDHLPIKYLEAVERCLEIYAGRRRGWDDAEFQQHFCENVVKPLQESCEVW